MANPQHLALLKKGTEAWNDLRVNLIWPDLSEAILRGAILRGADLSEADLRRADLSGADLNWAILRRANLSGADLRGADLKGAILSRAYLTGANLSQANLSQANLSQAILSGADLSGTDLSNALFDASTSLSNVIFDDSTSWPSGFDLPVTQAAESWAAKPTGPSADDFTISFDPGLSAGQIKIALEALADYFRACGGAGFKIDFEIQTVSARELDYVGR